MAPSRRPVLVRPWHRAARDPVRARRVLRRRTWWRVRLRGRRRGHDAVGRLHRADSVSATPHSLASAPTLTRSWLSHGVPLLIALPVAGLFTGSVRYRLSACPTLRMSGLYLAIATLAFGSIVGTVFQKWEAITGGFDGFAVPAPDIFGVADPERDRHLLPLARGAGDRAVALRKSAAQRRLDAQWWQSATVRYPRRAWASIWRATRRSPSRFSAFITGLAGALFAHYVRFLAPGRIRRAAVGAVCHHRVRGRAGFAAWRCAGRACSCGFCRSSSPSSATTCRLASAFMPGLEPSLYGLVLVLVILFEPGGIYGLLDQDKSAGSRPIRSSAARASGGRSRMPRSERLR